MPDRYLTKERVDEAVRKSLEYNSQSSVMFLLRERMIREILDVSAPILIKPLLERIAELEEILLGQSITDPEKVQPPKPPTKVSNAKLDKLREALNDMVEVMED